KNSSDFSQSAFCFAAQPWPSIVPKSAEAQGTFPLTAQLRPVRPILHPRRQPRTSPTRPAIPTLLMSTPTASGSVTTLAATILTTISITPGSTVTSPAVSAAATSGISLEAVPAASGSAVSTSASHPTTSGSAGIGSGTAMTLSSTKIPTTTAGTSQPSALRKAAIRKRVPHPCAFFAQGWDSTVQIPFSDSKWASETHVGTARPRLSAVGSSASQQSTYRRPPLTFRLTPNVATFFTFY